jgi:hypothetical protein
VSFAVLIFLTLCLQEPLLYKSNVRVVVPNESIKIQGELFCYQQLLLLRFSPSGGSSVHTARNIILRLGISHPALSYFQLFIFCQFGPGLPHY